MKVLISGCNGQLGLELVKQFQEKGEEYEIIRTDIHEMDITDPLQTTVFLNSQKPDVIINTAAYTDVDGCEVNQAKAFRVNALGAKNLAIAACKIGAKIVQLSTDYVFDGTCSEPRREHDAVNPLNVYGKSKLLGENLVRKNNPRHFIVRTAWLYGEGNNFVRTMLRLAGERKEIDVVYDQIGTPTSTVDLAKCIINLIGTESYGIYHATCEGFCSWYDFAKKIFEFKHIDVVVNPISSNQSNRLAVRPEYSVLDNDMLKRMKMNTFRYWEDALKEYLKEKS